MLVGAATRSRANGPADFRMVAGPFAMLARLSEPGLIPGKDPGADRATTARNQLNGMVTSINLDLMSEATVA